jgi:hypothetical protein
VVENTLITETPQWTSYSSRLFRGGKKKKGTKEKQIKKSSKGYVMLKSVYDEYKQKGLIDKNFPTKTLREVIVIARSLDKILEKDYNCRIII